MRQFGAESRASQRIRFGRGEVSEAVGRSCLFLVSASTDCTAMGECQDEFSISEFSHKCCFLPVPFLHMDKFASIQCHSGLWKQGRGLSCDLSQN